MAKKAVANLAGKKVKADKEKKAAAGVKAKVQKAAQKPMEKKEGRAGKKQGEAKKAGAGKKPQLQKEAKAKVPGATKAEQLAASAILIHPLITEKAVNMIETENKLVFIVSSSATKQDVRKAVESLYGVKVERVNIVRDTKARKRALVRLGKAYKAEDVATKLGVL